MIRYALTFLAFAMLAGCGGSGMVKATSGLDRGFDDLGCLSRNFKGGRPCEPKGG